MEKEQIYTTNSAQPFEQQLFNIVTYIFESFHWESIEVSCIENSIKHCVLENHTCGPFNVL